MFAMLTLVLARRLPLLFVGWEGVGLCSYLLIGFWYKDIANAAAGQKAFIVNRVGDFAFAGMFLIVIHFKTLDFPSLSGESVGGTDRGMDCRHLPVAAGRRHRQVGAGAFIRGLPDAMEGPTPVSG
jgi:NADH-quinone oxidoreductase subunit L